MFLEAPVPRPTMTWQTSWRSAMADKKSLADALGADSPPPPIRRGVGMRLSTEPVISEPSTTEAPAPTSKTQTIAETQKRRNAETQKRINRGYALREDLIKACKRIAIDEDRNLYEVMEEALAQYIESKQH